MPYWGRYIPVAERRAKAQRQMDKLRKKGKDIQPVEIDGRKIAQSFWGKGWCDHLESFSDYANRLPRGRAYVRNGSVCHLEVQPGRIEAFVAGSSLYAVSINIKRLKAATWRRVTQKCSGQIGSMLELLQGRLSHEVMSVVSDRKDGLFPQPGEIELSCSCPDWAVMCKHVAAVLYGVGNRLDACPELLFLLRDVDAQELIAAEMTLPEAASGAQDAAIADDQLSAIFGIDIDTAQPDSLTETAAGTQTQRSKRSASTAKKKKARQKKSRQTGESSSSARQQKKAAAGKKKTTKNTRAAQAHNPRIRPTGKSVARLRKKLGLSATGFARELGVTPATVYRWEATCGRLKLQARCLHALAEMHQRSK